MRTSRPLLLLLLLAGCGARHPDSTDVTTGSLDAVGPRAYDALAYDLKAKFDWTTRTLTATEQITVRLQGTQKVELDARVRVSRVHLGRLDLPFTQANDLLTVDVAPLATRSIASFTVEFTADAGDALIAAAGGSDGDPVSSHVVFTDSEPDRGSQWLVANHHPSDRALFAVAITVPAGEDVIANGERLLDVTKGGQRTVAYALPLPIPTYLMAFAAGELMHADRQHGRIPLSVWYRKGLLIDPQKNLDAVEDAMTTFERVLGTYPWERYSVVVLPDFPEGGMENATITFNYEQSAQGRVDFATNAHELAHHWFGDWVTMHDFDDVWVKEGMATLLEYEADRARLDEKGSGRLFGGNLTFNPSDAIVDDSLHGLAKYTSGPYARAAWVITQIRDRVGEERFWATLRKVLRQHALGSVTGEQFLRSFAPALDEATITQLLASLQKKAGPQLDIASTRDTDATHVTLTLTDPSGQLISPPRMNVIGADGSATPATLTLGTPVTLDVPAAGYLAPDERGVHPLTPSTFTMPAWYALVPTLLPSDGPALAAFEARSPAHQELALRWNRLTALRPAQYQALHDALTSQRARAAAEDTGCATLYQLTAQGRDTTEWTQALLPSLRAPAYERYTWTRSSCGPAVGVLFADELAQAAAATTAANAGRVDYLISFDYGVGGSLAAIGNVATTSPSQQLRLDADSRLVWQAAYFGLFTPVVEPADVDAWSSFFDGVLTRATTSYQVENVWSAVQSLPDPGALPILAAQLHTIAWAPGDAAMMACEAYGVSQAQPGSWDAFAQAAQPWTTLPADVQAILADPTVCDAASPLRAARANAKAVRAATAPLPSLLDGAPAPAATRPLRHKPR